MCCKVLINSLVVPGVVCALQKTLATVVDLRRSKQLRSKFRLPQPSAEIRYTDRINERNKSLPPGPTMIKGSRFSSQVITVADIRWASRVRIVGSRCKSVIVNPSAGCNAKFVNVATRITTNQGLEREQSCSTVAVSIQWMFWIWR